MFLYHVGATLLKGLKSLNEDLKHVDLIKKISIVGKILQMKR